MAFDPEVRVAHSGREWCTEHREVAEAVGAAGSGRLDARRRIRVEPDRGAHGVRRVGAVEGPGVPRVSAVAVSGVDHRVQLDPMSLSVAKGQTISFKCLSPDDSWQQFTYEWFKVIIIIIF